MSECVHLCPHGVPPLRGRLLSKLPGPLHPRTTPAAGFVMCGNMCIDPTQQCCVSDSVGQVCTGTNVCKADGAICDPAPCPAGTVQCGYKCIDDTADPNTGVKQCCVDATKSTVGNFFNGYCYAEPACPIYFKASRWLGHAGSARSGMGAQEGSAAAHAWSAPCRSLAAGHRQRHQRYHRGQAVPLQPHSVHRVLRRHRLPGQRAGQQVHRRHVHHQGWLHHVLVLGRKRPPGVQAGAPKRWPVVVCCEC